jgi:hypothetical protein
MPGMGLTTQFYMVLTDLPPRYRALLQHLATLPQPFVLCDAALPPGGVRGWSEAIQVLCARGALERVGWSGVPRYRVPDSVLRALQVPPPPPRF